MASRRSISRETGEGFSTFFSCRSKALPLKSRGRRTESTTAITSEVWWMKLEEEEEAKLEEEEEAEEEEE